METVTKRIRHNLVFDKKKDRLSKAMERRSFANQRPCLCRNQFRRYLDVRAAYFVDQKAIEQCKFYRVRVGSNLLTVRPLARLSSNKDFYNFVAMSKRGAQRLCQDATESICWLCQLIGKDANGCYVVSEMVVPEWFLEKSIRRFRHAG